MDKDDPIAYAPTLSKEGLKVLSDILNDQITGQQLAALFGGAAVADAEQLSDLSKGSISIFINFNKEIVDMDINIASVENIEELGRKLEPKIEEVVVRGLTIALNNATSVT